MCVKEQEEETQNKQTTAYTKRAKSALTGFHTNKDDNIQRAKTKQKKPSVSGNHHEFLTTASNHAISVISSCCNIQHNCGPFITTFQISYNHSVLQRPLIIIDNYMFQFRISPMTKAIRLF